MNGRVAVMLLTLVLAAPAPAQLSGEEMAVLRMLKELSDAGLARDADRIRRLYTSEYFHTNADGSVMTRERVLASYRAPTDVRFESDERDEVKVVLYGGAAVVNQRTTLRGRRGETELTSRFRVTYFLVKVGTEWKVASSHASFLAR